MTLVPKAGVVLVYFWVAAGALAQEAIRMSLAGEAAAEARRRAASTFGYYNLKLGPAAARFQSALGLQWTDNVRYVADDAESDLVLRPQINARFWWPITEKNSLNLSVGAGYSKYLRSSDLDRPFVRPGTEVSFDVYVGDFVINIHDRITIPMEVYEVPTISQRGEYQRLENIIGTLVHWDLHKMVVSFGYDHADYVSLTKSPFLVDGSSEILYARVGFALSPTTMTGIELGTALIDYSSQLVNDGVQSSAGVFFGGQITRYIQLRAQAGYLILMQSANGQTPNPSDVGAVYGQLSLTHRLNRLLTYTLSGGRTIQQGLQFGFYARSLDLTFVRWDGTWNLFRTIRVTTPLFFEHWSQTGFFPEDFDRLGGGINVGLRITEKLSATVSYQFFWKNSTVAWRNYQVNNLYLNFGYNF